MGMFGSEQGQLTGGGQSGLHITICTTTVGQVNLGVERSEVKEAVVHDVNEQGLVAAHVVCSSTACSAQK